MYRIYYSTNILVMDAKEYSKQIWDELQDGVDNGSITQDIRDEVIVLLKQQCVANAQYRLKLAQDDVLHNKSVLKALK